MTLNNFRTSWRLAGAVAAGAGWPNVVAGVVNRTNSPAINLNRRYVILSPRKQNAHGVLWIVVVHQLDEGGSEAVSTIEPFLDFYSVSRYDKMRLILAWFEESPIFIATRVVRENLQDKLALQMYA